MTKKNLKLSVLTGFPQRIENGHGKVMEHELAKSQGILWSGMEFYP